MRESRDDLYTLDEVSKDIKKNKAKGRLAGILFLVAIVVVGIYLCYNKFFNLEKLEIQGNCPYTEEEMIKGMGLEKGIGIYDKSQKEIRQSVKYNLPFLNSIKISRRWPSTIVAKVEEAIPTFYIAIGEDLYVLSQGLRVLSITKEVEMIEVNSLVFLQIDDIFSCVEGEYLEISEENQAIIEELVAALGEHNELNNVSVIDIRDRFNISLLYNKTYEIKLGDRKNFDIKIRFMQKILEKIHGTGASGIIDVSDEEAREGTFKNF